MHLIFDLDGTLVDSLPGIADALNQALHDFGFPPYPEKTVRGFIGNGTLELVRRALAQRDSSTHDPEPLAHEINAAFQHHYASSWKSGTTLYPHIADTIKTLAAEAAQLAVLSNKPHTFTTEIVHHLFPPQTFAQILGQQPGLPQKPAPDPALHITHSWEIDPKQALLIGDSSIDLETAKAAKIPFLGVAWGYHDPCHLDPDPVSHPSSLLARIRAVAG